MGSMYVIVGESFKNGDIENKLGRRFCNDREGCWVVCPTCKKFIDVDGRWCHEKDNVQ